MISCSVPLSVNPGPFYGVTPYGDWIAAYTSESYRGVVRDAVAMLDRLGTTHGADARYPQLLATFMAATRLEMAFWDMGWRAG